MLVCAPCPRPGSPVRASSVNETPAELSGAGLTQRPGRGRVGARAAGATPWNDLLPRRIATPRDRRAVASGQLPPREAATRGKCFSQCGLLNVRDDEPGRLYLTPRDDLSKSDSLLRRAFVLWSTLHWNSQRQAESRRRRDIADQGSAGRCDGVTACSRPPVRREPSLYTPWARQPSINVGRPRRWRGAPPPRAVQGCTKCLNQPGGPSTMYSKDDPVHLRAFPVLARASACRKHPQQRQHHPPPQLLLLLLLLRQHQQHH